MVRIAVIGGGSAGVAATKTCLEYGYDVVCYEKSNDLGGVWRYKPYECEGEGTVMKSTVLNSSKEMSSYSDFPPPARYANYMHNRQMLQYFRSYAEHFNVLPHIKYLSEVQLVKRADDFDATGRWMVTVKDLKTSNITTEFFDGVMICSGHHVYPRIPEIPGLRENFAGQVLHSHSYKEPSPFVDKNVLVIGVGNSGVDITVEVSRSAKQTYLVTRRGAWVWNRVFDRGLPYDMVFNSHRLDPLMRHAPKLVQAVFERNILQRVDLDTYGLLPSHHLLSYRATVSDELPNRIATGTVVVKPNITKFTGPTSCTFEDGTSVDDIDTVILCTGYNLAYPCLEPGVISMNENKATLYKNMYPPDISHPETIAVIGYIQLFAGVFPVAEMQCRVFCEHIGGKRSLPSREEMQEDIRKKTNGTTGGGSLQSPPYYKYIPYMNELALMIDVQPPSPLNCLLNGDPELAWALAFGPCLSYEFRLRGPHAWPGARDAIVTVWDRVIRATKTRMAPVHRCGKNKSQGLECVIRDYSNYILGSFAFMLMLMLTVVIPF